jgi:hypothetical protein
MGNYWLDLNNPRPKIDFNTVLAQSNERDLIDVHELRNCGTDAERWSKLDKTWECERRTAAKHVEPGNFHVSICGDSLTRPLEIGGVSVTPVTLTTSQVPIFYLGKPNPIYVPGRSSYDPITITFDEMVHKPNNELREWLHPSSHEKRLDGSFKPNKYSIVMTSHNEVWTLTDAFATEASCEYSSEVAKCQISFDFGEAKHAIIKDNERILNAILGESQQ